MPHYMVLILLLLLCGAVPGLSDLYGDLGLKEEATDSEIKKAYRKLSRQLHPDHNPSPDAKEEYAKIQKAYGVLSDRKKKKVYDMMGEEALKDLESGKGQRQQQHMGFFGNLFGGGGQDDTRGEDKHLSLKVSLADIYNGNEHTLNIKKNKLRSKQVVKDCATCKAQPPKMQRVQLAPGFVVQQQVPPDCDHKCSAGSRQVITGFSQLLEVQIEQGIPEGHEIKFDMEGDESPDRLPGDVIFKVKSAPHPFLTRVKDNLEMDMRITLLQALVGFKKSFVHLDGREVEVERKVVTQPLTKMTLRGEGMPKHNVPSEKGNLIVTFHIDFPKHITTEQAEKIKLLLPN
uniref:J domain-containing protein n=1 Tax=Eutreptiella gymnastica TaxID=73025 RepID=A0A7S1JEM2_9EUGL